jgi:hypothetical protein
VKSRLSTREAAPEFGSRKPITSPLLRSDSLAILAWRETCLLLKEAREMTLVGEASAPGQNGERFFGSDEVDGDPVKTQTPQVSAGCGAIVLTKGARQMHWVHANGLGHVCDLK